MKTMLQKEIDKICEVGLNVNNMDRAYKLIDMCKDIATIDHYEAETPTMAKSGMAGAGRSSVADKLDGYMDSFEEKMSSLLNSATDANEKQEIQGYINRLRSLR